MLRPLVGLTVGKQAGRQVDETRMDLEIFKILYRLNYSAFYFVQYYCIVTTVLELHFSRLLSSKAYFKVCFEMGKFWLPFFSCQPLLLGTKFA